MTTILLAIGLGIGLHYFAKALERSDRHHRRLVRLADCRRRRRERELLEELQGIGSTGRDRNEPVDALVIRHLRGSA